MISFSATDKHVEVVFVWIHFTAVRGKAHCVVHFCSRV